MKLFTPLQIGLLLLALNTIGQQNWRQFTAQDGLASDMVYNISESKNGDLWIGTAEGVNRFTGIFEQHIVSLVSQGTQEGTQARTGDSAFSFFQTNSGQMWVRFLRDGRSDLQYFNGQEWDTLESLGKLGNLSISDMPQFMTETNGRLWVSTWDGIVGGDGTGWKLYDSEHSPDWIVSTSDGRLWSNFWKLGIASFDGQRWKRELAIDDMLLGEARDNTAFVTSKGMILIGTDKGIFQYDPGLNLVTDLKLGAIDIYLITEGTDGTIWAGADNGLYQYGGSNWQQHTYNGKLETTITAITETSDGIIWVAGKSGLFQYNRGNWSQELDAPMNCVAELKDSSIMAGGATGMFILQKGIQQNRGEIGLHGERIERIIQAPDGKMWFQSTRGISSFDDHQWIHYQEGVPSHPYRAMVADQKGNIWFARGGDDIYAAELLKFDGQKLKIVEDSNATGLIYDIAIDHSDNVWVVGRYRAPSVYDGQGWTRYSKGFPEGDFRQWGLGEDMNGKMWIGGGGTDGVLYYYDDGQWNRAMSFAELGANNKWTGFEAIFQARDGNLFAGVYGVGGDKGGIFRQATGGKWIKENDSPRIYGFHQAINGDVLAIDDLKGLLKRTNGKWHSVLPIDVPGIKYSEKLSSGFAEQPDGVFWLSTNKGLLRIEGDFWYFMSVAEGLPSNNVRTVARDNKGNIWVGTEFGVTHFKPQKHPRPPALKVTKIDGEDVESKIENEGSEFLYQTGRPFVSIEWIGGDFQTTTQRMLYQYKAPDLDTGQENWSSLTRESSVTLGLPNGRNNLSVRAIDHHFNQSQIVSLVIEVNTAVPEVALSSPTEGQIVSGRGPAILVKGTVNDGDLDEFRVEFSPITDPPVFQLINQAEVEVERDRALGLWNAQDLPETQYLIRLLARDELGHQKTDQIRVTLDNTLPTVKIQSPKDKARVLKTFTISALLEDHHLDSYRLDYSATNDSTTNDWEQIYMETGLYPPKDETKPGMVNINEDWAVLVKEGWIWLRLMGTDKAGNTNTQTIQVEVPTAVVTRKGGTIFPQDQQAELYFPPNTLAEDTIVTVNALPEVEVEPPVRRVSQIYDFAPTTLRLNSIKPATLTISYDPSQLSAGQEPLIFHRTDGAWKSVGGTVNAQQQTISAAVLSLGQYTLGEMDKIQALDSAKLKPDSLTCQPRVFSPKGNAFSTHTTISFTLDQPAQVTIKVYNVAGQLVEWMAQQQTFSSGKQAIRWNGRDSDGQVVATGLYIVTVAVGSQRQDKVVNIWNH